MKINKESDETLVISEAGSMFERLFMSCAIVFSAIAIYRWLQYPDAFHRENFQGALGGAATGLVGWVATFERSFFMFDRKARVVQWRRRRSFASKSGSTPFSAITQVTAKRMIGDNKYYPQRRVAIQTASQEIPLTSMFTIDNDNECVELADKIRKFIL